MFAIVREEYFDVEYESDMYERAMAVIGEEQYKHITSEYKSHAGLWHTEKVLLQDQVNKSLAESEDAANNAAINQ